MIIFIQAITLLFLMILYIRTARRIGIFDKPNERSSHSKIIVRGGGIIFPIAVLFWFVLNGLSFPIFILGLTIISAISFIDDIYSVDHRLRLIVHFIAVLLLSYNLKFIELSWYWWIIFLVLMIGWINAFNFMDGINGMTAFYAMSVLIPIYILNEEYVYTSKDLIVLVGISLFIFSLFNVRSNALCFAGDVGSVAMAFILGYFVSSLIINTGRWIYILFLVIYGVDSILTIIYRLIRGENITEAHRSHLYQYLANEGRVGHIYVSAAYSLLQLCISIIVIKTKDDISPLLLTLIVLFLTINVYVYLRRYILKKV